VNLLKAYQRRCVGLAYTGTVSYFYH